MPRISVKPECCSGPAPVCVAATRRGPSGPTHVVVAGQTVALTERQRVVHDSKCLECPRCYKSFARHWNLIRHYDRCVRPKTDPRVCPYCLKTFAFASGKSRHLNTCSAHHAVIDATLDLRDAEEASTVAAAATVVYDNDSTTFAEKKLSVVQFRRILSAPDEGNTLATYVETLMKDPRNHFVRKTNARSSTSLVCVADGPGGDAAPRKWVEKLDAQVYKNLTIAVAVQFETFLTRYRSVPEYARVLRERSRFVEKLNTFIGYMADGGYAAGSAEHTKKQLSNFVTLAREIRMIVTEATRKASLSEKEKALGLAELRARIANAPPVRAYWITKLTGEADAPDSDTESPEPTAADA